MHGVGTTNPYPYPVNPGENVFNDQGNPDLPEEPDDLYDDESSSNEGIPQDLRDPITLQPITDPLQLSCGHIYEEATFYNYQGPNAPFKCLQGCSNVRISQISNKQLKNGLVENIENHKTRNKEKNDLKQMFTALSQEMQTLRKDIKDDYLKEKTDLKAQLTLQVTQELQKKFDKDRSDWQIEKKNLKTNIEKDLKTVFDKQITDLRQQFKYIDKRVETFNQRWRITKVLLCIFCNDPIN